MLPHLLAYYGGEGRIVEPFFGGGAFSFHMAAKNSSLEVIASDYLSDLMDIYRAVRTDVEGFIGELDQYASAYLALERSARREYYYSVRGRYMRRELDGPAPLYFLLRCAYSGMYRTGVEFPGRFNTSHGFGLERPGFHMPDRLRAAAKVMTGWSLLDGDFSQVLHYCGPGSFVLLDPPYRQTYKGYTGQGFSDEDQLRVVAFYKEAVARGATVVLTNKDLGDGYYEEHLPGCNISRVPIRYSVNRNCSTVGRPQSHEVIVSSVPARAAAATSAQG